MIIDTILAIAFLHFFDISEMYFYWYPVHKSSGSLWNQKT